MTKSALKMYLSAVSMFLISGCTYSSDALFPSLFGSDAQEEMAAGDGGFSDEAVPALGSTNFEPLEISEGGNTGTFDWPESRHFPQRIGPVAGVYP